MIAIPIILALVSGYLIGSVMTAVKIAKKRNRDIHKCGSGNAGSTNILRTFGWKWGLICLASDSLKGVLSVLCGCFIGWIFETTGWVNAAYDIKEFMSYVGLLGAMIGHLLPVFYNFRGGKCVSVALGGFLTISPVELLIALAIALLLIAATRMVSVGSVIGTILAAAFIIIKHWGNIPLTVLCVIIAAVVVIAHLPNIQRIAEGHERRLERIEWEKRENENKEKTADNNTETSKK